MDRFSVSLRGLAALAVVCAFACLATAGASAAPLVVVGNAEGESVSVVNTQTNKVVGTPIELESAAAAIAIVPGGTAYVAERRNNAVAVINPATRKKLKSIPVGELPEYLALSPDGKTLYVANFEDEDVTVIDTATNTSLGSIPVGGSPYAVAFAPSGELAYVGVGHTLVTIDPSSGEVVGEPIQIGEGPRVIAFSPDGETAYLSEQNLGAVAIVDIAIGEEVGSIPMPAAEPWGLAVSPDGSRLYVADQSAGAVTAFSTATNKPIGTPIKVGESPLEIALTPNGRTLYVANEDSNNVTPIDTALGKALAPIEMPGLGPWQLAITPDLSPTAIFGPPNVTATVPAAFSGIGSSDPDGSIASYSWTFGDGATAIGVAPVHAYSAPGAYSARLTVLDNEGCGAARVFTGRTAYCSGNPAGTVTHPVTVKVPLASPAVCSARFRVAGVSHNRKNGTVRLRLKFTSTGWFLLFGKKIHAVTRKVRKPGTTVVTLHARVELNKRLKKTLRAGVRYRVTFTPNAGCGSKTVHRSVALLRAPRHKHRH